MTRANLAVQTGKVTRLDRARRFGHTGLVVWMVGLSGSGKTSIAIEAEKALFDGGYAVCRLDGDQLRMGLNAGLGFSPADREENLRRAAEVARLFAEAGMVVLACFISPTRRLRAIIRERIPPEAYFEVYVRASLEACIQRDPKGFYRRALAGEIPDYTGVGQAFEPPERAGLLLDTEALSLEQCAAALVEQIIERTALDRSGPES
ncbi:MAG TPA: adenylyl-sulfate kinase [Chloroflexi bacterium]|nr:adenylyl-sulfate kinase [Chloroflexota bacterium]